MLLQGLYASLDFVFGSRENLAHAMVYLTFTCIHGTRVFVYENNIGNTFVEANCHSISSYAELVFPLSKSLASLSFVIKCLLLRDNGPLT